MPDTTKPLAPESREREEIAQLCAGLARERSLEVQLFAAELAGRIRARSVPETPDHVTIAEAARLLKICRGRIPQLVSEGALPIPDEHGRFNKGEILKIQAWLGPFMARDQFERIAKLRLTVRSAGPLAPPPGTTP